MALLKRPIGTVSINQVMNYHIYLKLLWQRFPSNPGLQIQIPELSSHVPWFEHELSPGQNISEMKDFFCCQEVLFGHTPSPLLMGIHTNSH